MSRAARLDHSQDRAMLVRIICRFVGHRRCRRNAHRIAGRWHSRCKRCGTRLVRVSRSNWEQPVESA